MSRDLAVTAVLNGFERPYNLNSQIDAVESQSIKPDEILLWYNKGEKPQIVPDGVNAAVCNTNFGVYARFAYAMMAKTPYVAILDDDTIPGPHFFRSAIRLIEEKNCMVGTVGVILTRDEYPGHRRTGWPTCNVEAERVDLIGHAWVMRREWLHYLWQDMPLLWNNGEDIHLSAILKMNGIESYVSPHPAANRTVWGSLMGNELGSDAAALWKRRSYEKHKSERTECVRHWISKGWKPMFMEGGI